MALKAKDVQYPCQNSMQRCRYYIESMFCTKNFVTCSKFYTHIFICLQYQASQWKRMTLEASHIQVTNGHTCYYIKNRENVWRGHCTCLLLHCFCMPSLMKIGRLSYFRAQWKYNIIQLVFSRLPDLHPGSVFSLCGLRGSEMKLTIWISRLSRKKVILLYGYFEWI